MYAPITVFGGGLERGAFVGHAAPASGYRPCAVALWSDDRQLTVVAATRFSADARDAGLRHGWCGFRLENVGEAFAVGVEATLRCIATGQILARPSAQDLVSQPTAVERRSVEAMLADVRRSDCAETVEQIMPFAISCRSHVGREEFVEKTLAMLLRRPIAFSDALRMLHLRGDEGAEVVLKRTAALREFTTDPLRHIPGPFHPSFRYRHRLFG